MYSHPNDHTVQILVNIKQLINRGCGTFLAVSLCPSNEQMKT